MPGGVCVVRQGYFPQDPRVRKEVCTLQEENYQVDVICMRNYGDKMYEEWHDIRIHRLPVRHKRRGVLNYIIEYFNFFIRAFIKINLLSMKRRFDIIQINTMPDFLVFSTVITRFLFGTKILLDMHEAMPELFMSMHNISKKHIIVRLLKLQEILSTNYADHVIAVNAQIKQIYANRGTPANKISIVLNSANDKIFTAVDQNYKNSDNSNYTIVTVGTILKRYGFDILIKALKLIVNEISQVKAIVIGEGEDLGEIVQLTKKLELTDRVDFTGFISQNEIARILEKANIGVVPMISDCFTNLMLPNKIFELIAMGVPVIASRLKTISEYFDDTAVYYFTPGNEMELAEAIIILYNDPQKCQQLVNNASTLGRKYAWVVQRQIYCSIIRKLMNRKIKLL